MDSGARQSKYHGASKASPGAGHNRDAMFVCLLGNYLVSSLSMVKSVARLARNRRSRTELTWARAYGSIDHANLWHFARRRPLDLDWLIRFWQAEVVSDTSLDLADVLPDWSGEDPCA